MRIISKRLGTTGERRSAFTLIEMLIVITIILILVGLLAAAVIKLIGKGAEAQVQSEFDGLSQAIGAFKQEFGVSYIPSQILLCEDGNYSFYTSNPASPYNQLAIDSQTYLQQMFGSRYSIATTPVKWRQDGQPSFTTKNNPPMILEGQHCLVFFLGGVQAPATPGSFGTSGTCTGFSTDPTNPTTVGGTRRGPFYDFKTSRLFLDSRNIGYGPTGTALNFFVYIDAFGKASPSGLGYTYPKQPFAFFSSYRTANNYNRYAATLASPDCPSIPFQPTGYPPTAKYASASMTPLQPYSIPNTANFLNPNSFQILSAGQDGVWGAGAFNGGPWVGATGQGTPGLDDWGNFSRVFLGAPQQ
jgi:prepilin-type N-terminal cleavage/methylation domain-containing protein